MSPDLVAKVLALMEDLSEAEKEQVFRHLTRQRKAVAKHYGEPKPIAPSRRDHVITSTFTWE